MLIILRKLSLQSFMKPKDLKPLCSWSSRAPMFGKQLFYVPNFYNEHEKVSFPEWSCAQIFGNTAPVYLEYCSGNGSWIASKAHEESQCNWVAIEKKFDRVRKIWSKSQNLHLPNLFTVWGEAFTFTHFYIPSHSITKIFINFPDPWPKKKQKKHRLITSVFIAELVRILKKEGTITFVTDDQPYLLESMALFFENPHLTSAFPEPFYVNEWPNYGTSYFDSLWREKGRAIHYLHLIKT